jgi:glycerol-3-phosphate acyltransferase PlsY
MNSSHILLVVFAYLLGAVPFGVVVARIMGGRDPRSAGSKNIGATNVGRTVGKTAGIITLALDILKGFLPVLVVAMLHKEPLAPALVGLAAFLGHLYPVYLGFKGGKGIATGAGVFLAASPAALGIAAVVFGLALWRSRMVSLGSILGCAALPVAAFLLKEPKEIVALGGVIAVLSIWKHRENIKRIMAGTESRLGEKA